jgi:drug/metabolite transporter (DMT)-like permease
MLPGLGIGILSAFLTALLSSLNKRHVGAGSAEALTFIQIGAGTLFVAAGMLLVEGVEPLLSVPSRDDLALLPVLAVACTLLPYVLWLRALQHISAFATQLALNLEPVYAIVIAALWFREDRELSLGFYAGVLLILSAVVIQPVLRARAARQRAIFDRWTRNCSRRSNRCTNLPTGSIYRPSGAMAHRTSRR